MSNFEGLPDITEPIAKVMEHYDESLRGTFNSYDPEDVDEFVKAWLHVQVEQAQRLYTKRFQAKAKSVSVS